MLTIPSVLLATALLFAIVLSLTLKPAFSKKLTTGCMVLSLIGGLLYYGVGFFEVTHHLLMSVIRTTFCVIRMFLGVNELASIEGSTLVSTTAGRTVFWILHLMAFYSMASAAMITLGAEMLRYLRLVLARRGHLVLIYGINENSIAFGKDCLGEKDCSVVYIAENAATSLVSDLNSQGMSVITGSAAVACEKSVMRRLHVRKRKISVFALDADRDQNLFYALRLKDQLEKAGVPAENTRITLPGAEDILMPMLQVSRESYGYGYVNVYDEASLAARALIRVCPPWEYMDFAPDGRCRDDFECVVVGFGRHGQAVLKQLVMNGQFAGSVFHAAVFSPSLTDESGYLQADSPELLRQYDIHGYTADGRSSEFYDYISTHLQTLRLVVVCTGNRDTDREISENLMLYLKRREAERICVVQCSENGVRYQKTVGSPIIQKSIYTREFLSAELSDRLAILLNATYDDSEASNWDKWVACDSFGKMSSRASADFIPAFINASGSSREEILAGNWHPDEKMLEVLGETEHLRWCAFHYAMGYSAMSEEEFANNASEYLRCKEAGLPCNRKIGKNAQTRTHACLIPWEDLDSLSRREHDITGREIDYKQTDINNVLALPQLLKAEQKQDSKINSSI